MSEQEEPPERKSSCVFRRGLPVTPERGGQHVCSEKCVAGIVLSLVPYFTVPTLACARTTQGTTLLIGRGIAIIVVCLAVREKVLDRASIDVFLQARHAWFA
jgi:hypothetical protein